MSQGFAKGGDGVTDHGALTGLADDDHTQYFLTNGSRKATFVDVAGLTGATAASRYVGATTSGAPASGTFAVGDYIIDQTGSVYVCTVAGTSGTWVEAGNVTNGDTHDHAGGDGAQVDHGGLAGLADDDHTQYTLKTTLTTKGDLYVASAASTPARLAVGVDNSWPVAASGETVGVKWRGFVGCKAKLSANQSVASATIAVLGFDAEDFDTDAFHDTVTNNSRLTVPAGLAGYYRLTSSVWYQGNSTGDQRQVRVHKNGTAIQIEQHQQPNAVTACYAIDAVFELVAADYLEVGVYHNADVALNILGGGVDDSSFAVLQYLGP